MSEKLPLDKIEHAIGASVIDWLQWNQFEERLDQPDYPQLALKYISKLKEEIKLLHKRLEAAEKLREAMEEMALDADCLLTDYQMRELASNTLIEFEEAVNG